MNHDRLTVLAAILATAERDVTGMAWTATVSRAAGLPGPLVVAILLAMGRAEIIELRPESGMGRLSKADAALCPTAYDGTPLSWIRLL